MAPSRYLPSSGLGDFLTARTSSFFVLATIHICSSKRVFSSKRPLQVLKLEKGIVWDVVSIEKECEYLGDVQPEAASAL